MFGCVTTFPSDHWGLYAKQFLETYVEHWRVPIWVYYEGSPPPLSHFLINYLPLDADKDRLAFLKRHNDKQSKDYRRNAVKFCHKVFALTDPGRIQENHAAELLIDCWVWLDADIETFAPVDEAWLEGLCPPSYMGAYLGRQDWHHSECGLMMFRGAAGKSFLSEFRRQYTSGKMFDLPEWHDSYVFDELRKKIGGDWADLSVGIPGQHVWDDCILGTKMRHRKGPLRKAGKLHGARLPEGYMSQKELREETGFEPVFIQDGQPAKLSVKTKNCIAHDKIRANVHYSMTVIPKWLPPMKAHDRVAVFCSGGPSLNDALDEVRGLLSRPKHDLICVKHAQDTLIEAGMIPFACILLDPRSHVQDFVENPHPQVKYFTASMCHPTTVDALLNKNAQVWGYHAAVGAGEIDVVRERSGNMSLYHFMVEGGCATATRGIALLRYLGYRKLKLYAYDLAYESKPDTTKKTKMGDSKYYKVNLLGKEFWTDAEKVAQSQDFVRIMRLAPEMDLEIEASGPGMIPQIWKVLKDQTTKIDFNEVFAPEQKGSMIGVG